MRDVLGLVTMLVLLLALVFAVRKLADRFEFSGELKRKMVHVGMGLVTLTFPWVFSSWTWVAALSLLSLLVLHLVRSWERRKGKASVLHDVKRDSVGQVCFPLAVVIVFAMAHGEAWRFIIPILVLTLADAAGALVGVNYGKQRFHVLSGWKTPEGSLLVFFVAFLSVHVPLLLLTEIGRPETLLIALTLALLAMLIEAVSDYGLDNLILPVMIAWLLGEYADKTAAELMLRCSVILSLLILVLLGKRFSSLEGGAMLGAVLLGYACFFFGDWRFLIPPLILFGEHLWVSHRIMKGRKSRDMGRNDLWVILALALSFAPWLWWAMWPKGDVTVGLRGFVTTAAIHLAILNYTTRAFITSRAGNAGVQWRSILKGITWILLPGFLLSGADRTAIWMCAMGAVLVALGLTLFRWISGQPGHYPNTPWRWGRQALAATLASMPIWAGHVFFAS